MKTSASRAFTLLELLIVLLIIGILIAIGLYRYQSVVEVSYDTDAKAALRAAVINAEAVRTKMGSNTYATGANPEAIDDLAEKLNNKSDGLIYIPWSDNEPSTTGLTPNFTGNNHKQILTSIQPGNTMVAFCNKSKSGKAFCLGTSEAELSTFASTIFAATNLNVAFTSSSHADSVAKAYCALGTPDGSLPRGCDENDPDQTGGTHGWLGTGNGSGGNTDPVGDYTPVAGADSSALIFSKRENGSSCPDTSMDIWSLNVSTGVAQKIADAPAGVVYMRPRYSPNLARIAFSVYHCDSSESELRVMNSNGTNEVTIDQGMASVSPTPDWGTNNTLVYQRQYASNSSNIYLATLDSNNNGTLTQLTTFSANTETQSPTLSDDGTVASFYRRNNGSGQGHFSVPVNNPGTYTALTDGNPVCCIGNLTGGYFYYQGPLRVDMSDIGAGSTFVGAPGTDGGDNIIVQDDRIYYYDYNNNGIYVSDIGGANGKMVNNLPSGTYEDYVFSVSPSGNYLASRCSNSEGEVNICITQTTGATSQTPTVISSLPYDVAAWDVEWGGGVRAG